MTRKLKNDVVKDFLTAGIDGRPGDYLSGPFNLPPEPAPAGTEVRGAPTIDTGHEFVIRKAKPLAED
jgi:hypothetical protein